MPEFLLKDDDESDFEIDPCTLSSPTGAEDDDGDGLPQMAEILAPLKGSPPSEEGLNLNMIGRCFLKMTLLCYRTTYKGGCQLLCSELAEQ